MCKPSKEINEALNGAYDYFNAKLFADRLPDCVLMLHRKRGAYGYFWGGVWKNEATQATADEIAIDPQSFGNRPVKEMLSTLVHEMCHLEQHHFGKPSRSGYHNKQWADYMEAVGLTPSTTAAEGGKRTGQKCSHYIEPNGRYEQAFDAYKKTNADGLAWFATTGEGGAAKKRKNTKLKYTCGACDANAWGKAGLNLVCGDCEETMYTEE